MWCRKSGKVDGLYSVEVAFRVQQADNITRDQATQRISNNAYLCDLVAALLKFLDLFLDFIGSTFAAQFYAIIGEAVRVALGDEDV